MPGAIRPSLTRGVFPIVSRIESLIGGEIAALVMVLSLMVLRPDGNRTEIQPELAFTLGRRLTRESPARNPAR